MSQTLSTVSQLQTRGNATRDQVLTAMKRASLEPVHTAPYGKGVMAFYESAPALVAIEAYLGWLDRLESDRVAAAEAQRTAQEAKPLTLAAIIEAIGALIDRDPPASDQKIAVIEAIVTDTQDSVEKMATALAKLADQNVLLFRALKDMETDHTARLARLQNTMIAMQPSAAGATHVPQAPAAPAKAASQAPAPAPIAKAIETAAPKTSAAKGAQATAPSPAPRRRLARVVVVGLKGSDRASIEKEFKDCFDLVAVEVGTGDPPRSFETIARNCDRVVLAFGSSTMTRVKHALQAAGVIPMHVNGGMSRLRDTLTSLYVELNEKEHA